MEDNARQLSWRTIFVFWAPLSATWLMMALEGPFLAAVIARMADPKFNLAAYGVSFSLALILEAPIIMIMSASTALVSGPESLKKLWRFTFVLNISITTAMLLVLLPPVFNYIALDLMELDPRLGRLTHMAMVLMLPWPAAIGYRRFYQGILIRYNRTRFVAYGTAVRLTTMGVSALVCYLYLPLPGAYVGALALSLGVTVEAVASRLMVNPLLKQVRAIDPLGEAKSGLLTYGSIIRFYYPLALTTIMALGVRPLVTFFVGQSRMALESLAVLPVVFSLIFITMSFGMSFQEVVIALMDAKMKRYRALSNFAWVLGLATVCALGLIGFTPASHWWFHRVSGLSLELTVFAITPLQVSIIIPGLWAMVCFQRAILMTARRTVPITRATLAEVLIITVMMMVTIWHLDLLGAVAASISLVMGSMVSVAYLYIPFRRAVSQKYG